VGVGECALQCGGNSQYNVGVGWSTLLQATGGCNTAIGGAAGQGVTTGNYNTLIGANVQAPNPAGSCQLAIGWENNNWLSGDSGKNIQPGAGIRDCAGSLGTSGQVLTTTGGAIQWASSTKGYAYGIGPGAPVNLATGLTIPLSGVQGFQLFIFASNILGFTLGKKYALNFNLTAATNDLQSIVRWVNNIGQVGPEIYLSNSFANRPLSVSSSWIYAPVAGSEAIQLRVATGSLYLYPSATSVMVTEL
jgi:hypothetical protein